MYIFTLPVFNLITMESLRLDPSVTYFPHHYVLEIHLCSIFTAVD